jgi:anti-sigma factor RsiW
MRDHGTSGPRPSGSDDRTLWERSLETEASPEETERFLDLAAFVDRRLDEDERERVAALLARDADAAADAAAAIALRALPMPSVSEAIIARAVELPDALESLGHVVPFPNRQPAMRTWRGAAGWSGLAAAIVLASWLGFNLGSTIPGTTNARAYDDASAGELLDPAPLLLRDFSEGSQI